MNAIVTGSLGYDYIMDFPGRFADRIMPDKIHKLSLGFLVDKLSKQFGGTACNIGYTLKLLGVEPLILTAAGNDFGPYRAHLEKFNISTKYIREFPDVSTGSYHVITDQDDNQIGAFYEGAVKHNKELLIKDVYSSSEADDSAVSRSNSRKSSRLVDTRSNNKLISFVIISPHLPEAMVKHVLECQKLKIPYLYDPAFQIDNFTPKELQEGISGAQILIGNDYEIALIEKKLGMAHKELLKLVPLVLTTLGSNGSMIEYNPSSPPLRLRGGRVGVLKIKPARPDNTSDPTGAGDAYRAGFIAGYLRGFDLKTCGQMGSVAAVYTVEKYGTQTHYFTKKEFSLRYKENFGQTLRW